MNQTEFIWTMIWMLSIFVGISIFWMFVESLWKWSFSN